MRIIWSTRDYSCLVTFRGCACSRSRLCRVQVGAELRFGISVECQAIARLTAHSPAWQLKGTPWKQDMLEVSFFEHLLSRDIVLVGPRAPWVLGSEARRGGGPAVSERRVLTVFIGHRDTGTSWRHGTIEPRQKDPNPGNVGTHIHSVLPTHTHTHTVAHLYFSIF